MTITSAEENQFIYDNILVGNTEQPSITDEFYLGGKKNGNWGWLTGEALDYTNWQPGEPSGDGWALAIWGASQGYKSGLWNDCPHDGPAGSIHQLWAIVKYGDYSTDPKDTLINLVQWPVSEGGNDHWYGIIPIVQPWSHHVESVQNYEYDGQQGYLATITSAEENQFIFDNILVGNTEQPSITDEFYLGGFRDGSWGWLTGEEFYYTKWSPGEPSGDGWALAIWGASHGSKSGYWNDVPAYGPAGSIHKLWAIVEYGDLRGAEINVFVDIKPGSCPNPFMYRAQGSSNNDEVTKIAASNPSHPSRNPVLPVAVLGTENFDVSNIDVNTITLNDVPVFKSSYEDVASPIGLVSDDCECYESEADGFDDLNLKFDVALLSESIGDVQRDEIIILTLKGNLLDGTTFEGQDCILIRTSNSSNHGGGGYKDYLSRKFSISNNPNPFNPSTNIAFSLPEATNVILEIFNIRGQKIITLTNEFYEAGHHFVTWKSRDSHGNQVASGIYLYRIQTNNFIETKKMILLK